MADTTDHILNESIDTPEFYETVSSWKENSPDAALWSDVIDKINEYARREVASALASRPAEVDDRTPRPISTAPHDGTEVLAWSITGKSWHQVYWKTQENGDWLFLDPFPPRWACRWNSEYYQGQNEFSHWLPIPGAPSHTTNKEK